MKPNNFITFVKAAILHVLAGKRANIDTINYRTNKCEKCQFFNKESYQCNICGCYINIKAKMLEQDCPICAQCNKSREDCKCEKFISRWGLPTIDGGDCNCKSKKIE